VPVRRSAILVATLITPLSAQAAEVMFDGHYRARAQVFNTLSLDRTLSASEGMSSSIEHRVWLRPTFALNDQVTTFIDIRALDGVVWGQETGTQPGARCRLATADLSSAGCPSTGRAASGETMEPRRRK
jgi:hypothetical protein